MMKRRLTQTPDETLIAKMVSSGDYAGLMPVALRLLKRAPDHPLGLKALAASFIAGEKYLEAMPLLQRGVALYPGDPEMHSNLAIVLSSQGKYRESLESVEQSIRLDPMRADSHANHALAVMHMGDFEAAIDSCQRAIRLNPQHPEAHNTLGAIYHAQRRFPEALEAFRQGIQCNPESLDTFINFITTLGELDRHDEVIVCARRVLEDGGLSQDEGDMLLPYILKAARACCDWTHTDAPGALLDLAGRGAYSGLAPFFMTHIEGVDRSALLDIATGYGRARLSGCVPESSRLPAAPTTPLAEVGRRLRIGFLSAEFRNHPVSELAVGIYEQLDRRQFAVHAYAYGPNDSTALRRRLEAAFDVFHDIEKKSFADAADLIRRDGIDVLVDMTGWTQYTRLPILAHSPAPVIATWLGFPGTLGVEGLAHYLISDPVVTPVEHSGDYAEKLALLPHCYQPSSRVPGDAVSPGRKDVGLPEEAFVFCSFNQSSKITPAVFTLWCELLKRNSHAVLWLGFQSTIAQENLRREAKARGVDSDRIYFAPWCVLQEHLARLPLADLSLDTFPYGSHTTGSDILWAGVPLVGYMGETFAGRVSASILHAVEMPELIATSVGEYFEIAHALANDPIRCEDLRQRLIAARKASPLYDTKQFSMDLGRLFQEMWKNHKIGRHQLIRLK